MYGVLFLLEGRTRRPVSTGIVPMTPAATGWTFPGRRPVFTQPGWYKLACTPEADANGNKEACLDRADEELLVVARTAEEAEWFRFGFQAGCMSQRATSFFLHPLAVSAN